MTAFQTPTDIGNRALQHVGVGERMVGLDDDTKAASEVRTCYDMLRQAELRRNVWRFATRRVILRPIGANTMLFAPTLWDATATYHNGSAVLQIGNSEVIDKSTYGTYTYWLSQIASNKNNQPGIHSGGDYFWDTYFGPMTVDEWDDDVSYFNGEVVFYNSATALVTSVPEVYRSVVDNNIGNTPNDIEAWDATVNYRKDEVVTYAGEQYMSRPQYNLGNTPVDDLAAWSSATTYSIGQFATALHPTLPGSLIYVSLQNSNTNHDPGASGASAYWGIQGPWAWTETIPGTVANKNWIKQNGVVIDLNMQWPAGTGPADDGSTRNVYRLPNGFLREAPQDPKPGLSFGLGIFSGREMNDWEYEGNYFTSRDLGPILFRFVADTTLVKDFDPMFCEGLAARIATAVCEPITQSQGKMQQVSQVYGGIMSSARAINAIETGPVEPPEDDYILVRR